MATPVATDHAQLARKFLERSKAYLAEGDLHQASEKGWGAASHIAKAIAALYGWPYEHHDEFDNVIVNARQRLRQPDLRQYGNAAHSLHRNYYKNTATLDPNTIQEDIDSVEKLVNALTPHTL